MDRHFFAVFASLKVSEKLQGLFEDVMVKRVATVKGSNAFRISIESNRLISKKDIYSMEEAIALQILGDKQADVRIIEEYHLSEQYTPKNLFEAYYESILLELEACSKLFHTIFAKAKYEFVDEDVLKINFEDDLVARNRAKDIKAIIEDVVIKRCNVPLKIEYDFVEPKKKKKAEYVIPDYIAAAVAKQSEDKKDSGAEESNTKEAAVSENKTEVKKDKPAAPKTEKKPFFEGKKEWKGSDKFVKKSDDPDVFYGRNVDEDAMPLVELIQPMGEVVVRGQIIELDSREIRNEKTILMFSVTDFTDSVKVKMFVNNSMLPEISENIKKGAFIKLKGISNIDNFDGELNISSIVGIKKIADFRTKRMDTSPVKRVELHCHTKMSDMDAVSDVKDIIKCAMSWGHKALAITDHGVVQAFTDANHAVEGTDFKIIYGVEGYLVDDSKDVVVNSKGQSLDDTYVVFDIETTGFYADSDEIIEIGAVKVVNGAITERYSTFVNPKKPIPYEIEKLTGISDDMVINERSIEEVLPEFLEFCGDAAMVAHNAEFDIGFIKTKAATRLNVKWEPTYVDTVGMARTLLPTLPRYKLDTVAKALKISLENHHRAVDDAGATAEIFEKFIEMLKDINVYDLTALNEHCKLSDEAAKKLKSYHVIILAKNDIGRINLYRLVSYSHLKYYYRQPRIPKTVLEECREGLIIGSACEAGELYQAILEKKSEDEIIRIAKFYDYLEIQPLGNNAFMVREQSHGIETEQDLIDINKKIVALGEKYNKPVVATCDVHFLNPEDEVYRRIIQTSKGYGDADMQAPLYLRTTEEMLKEFAYLGTDKAEEVVITNSNLIADMCEPIAPVRPDKAPPVIPDSDKTLREICYNKAHEMYGEELPPVVVERLERELNSIISNGFAVMYIIAQKLVWKSNDDGYLVGSRGSVGSSFVATMAGITEVNPLSPHYYCTNCHYSDFDSDDVKAFVGGAGCDMPDKMCPVCGTKLKKDGFDIPFETFLGFKGNKEPDIDLNFSGDYQSKAHDYTEVIFGKGQTFRAGTIGTLADKTAFGMVKKYYEEHNDRKRDCEINRLVQGLVGVRRTTGQHPGGIIVLPHGEEIYSFTPVQHPANDMTTKTITTHFDYHSIDHNLLKLDILGHDDPTMIRMLEDLTGLNAKEIPLDSKEVMSLFMNTEALGITPDDIGGCKLGALGIPEFGTDFAMQMVIDAKPTCFADLVRISGLSHGTDVWLGNAQTLIQEGKATISTAICTRDDIMTYLINMGVDKELSFTIMESVRKGKGLKPDMQAAMEAANVPDWYIWSCKKIKYMFPKAHAAAYVMMAWRIAYCKIFYPLAYYASFFTIRASGFTYDLMCRGREVIEYNIKDLRSRQDSLSVKEKDVLRDLRIVQEMYARGYEFMPIDVYRAKAKEFQIIDGKLMAPFSAIDGMGEIAALALEEAAKHGKFLSVEDLINRSKTPQKIVEKMIDWGILEGLSQTNQLSIFDVL
ncbi:MAG: PolC-type DNA polymerase III [Lachnospiraceae bacterium]|nr:PolC-type DNA polymerase III [Lachnospiraceae bacterium]